MEKPEEDLGGCIVNKITGGRTYIRDMLRKGKERLEQTANDHHNLDWDEANSCYEVFEQALLDGSIEPFSDGVQIGSE